jgi:hypothetical protein
MERLSGDIELLIRETRRLAIAIRWTGPMTKKVAIAIAIIFMLVPKWCSEARAQGSESTVPEYLIKAGFIYHFAGLVEWPASAFAQPNSPINICILGDDPFGSTMEQVVDNKQVGGRNIAVTRLKSANDFKEYKQCHMVFVSSSEKEQMDEIIRGVKGLPLLTIGDIPGFAEHGGIINFILEENKVRFEVNVDAGKQAHLNISSRLLSLAKIVKGSRQR